MSWLREYALPKPNDSGGHSHSNLVRLRGYMVSVKTIICRQLWNGHSSLDYTFRLCAGVELLSIPE